MLRATPVDDLNKLIETSDVISVHLPLNNATRGIVTAENLAHVKPGTLFINTARSSKSSNPVRCLPDCKRAMFPPHSTCSTMSR